MRVDIIKRHYSDDTKDYSIVYGVDKNFTFYVYSVPCFVSIYKGLDQKEALNTYIKYTKDFDGEEESF